MADQETNGYNDEASDFKRKSNASLRDIDQEDDAEETTKQSEKAQEYIRNILSERVTLGRKYPIADRLLEKEVETVQKSGKPPARRYIDIYREKPIKVQVKVLVPVKEHPKFNFVGKLLGPKGNSLKRLQEETMCKMAILGRGSMKDRKKEEELRLAMDPKYAHLNDDLHVEINALGPPAEAHARIAYALAEVRKFLIPDSNDFIRQEQMREMLEDPECELPIKKGYKKSLVPSLPPAIEHPPPSAMLSSPPIPPSSRVLHPQKKVLSILDKARTAMEENHIPRSSSLRYEESRYERGHYESSYAYHPQPPPPPPPRPKYDSSDYEHEYRRDYYRESAPYSVQRNNVNQGVTIQQFPPTATTNHGNNQPMISIDCSMNCAFPMPNEAYLTRTVAANGTWYTSYAPR
ncbi:KH domain-containing, RNA-binding, signal transduction-associated protein 3-like isoform X1 [Anopheles coustani]|uniref:KH domain-containing, RNA-binding, signal transduction-associated protein 3-like isoform X1 n=1 Tax=Anopheles coustani TaxID=139045 RepID=UPI00265B4907|nr:KH domain-containing, RNA-binding, signal transduction-associated protein 3-like isoform X1 [Anopheles coustani]